MSVDREGNVKPSMPFYDGPMTTKDTMKEGSAEHCLQQANSGDPVSAVQPPGPPPSGRLGVNTDILVGTVGLDDGGYPRYPMSDIIGLKKSAERETRRWGDRFHQAVLAALSLTCSHDTAEYVGHLSVDHAT